MTKERRSKNDEQGKRFNASTVRRFNAREAISCSFSVADPHHYQEHANRVDTPEGVLCTACVCASFDRQLDLHGAVFFSAGIPDPERCIPWRDFDFYVAAGNRCYCAAASTGHGGPHSLHNPSEAGAALRLCGGENCGSSFIVGDQHTRNGCRVPDCALHARAGGATRDNETTVWRTT